ncbi:Fur family transcriptional regulator [Aestuariirhabdus litorea]|uniref:Transcriptional repressor n=1 Tax=Aestuariirhabdus litorea TaxID=2528527 RepID=A0A3P3VL07_9GAMM|nr:Fur family transcriptional regulator [Aestuariirhabdus litorea]RRJ82558.1 transcriptional repressor [Aestuariirhabdus litorea]RWW92718.1 transcriptional repressor [Endozoicomonadaceae bacterium GTF-13]
MAIPASDAPLGCAPHNHQLCIDDALQTARERCAQRGARLTPLRERVLELVWQSHTPLGAYQILESLTREDGRRSAPPTVYRALEFLLEQGLVHRIASLNAFIGCPFPHKSHQGYFMICSRCSVAIELDTKALEQQLASLAASNGFSVEQAVVEVSGLCPRCREKEATP